MATGSSRAARALGSLGPPGPCAHVPLPRPGPGPCSGPGPRRPQGPGTMYFHQNVYVKMSLVFCEFEKSSASCASFIRNCHRQFHFANDIDLLPGGFYSSHQGLPVGPAELRRASAQVRLRAQRQGLCGVPQRSESLPGVQ